MRESLTDAESCRYCVGRIACNLHHSAFRSELTDIAWEELLFRSPVQGLPSRRIFPCGARMEATMHSVIYLIGLIVVVLLLLSFLGLR
jgi:hypothetical protein